MLTVVFGLFHGLVLLPVLLSLVGPRTEIESDVEDEVASNFFFVFLLLANVVSSFFVPPAIKAASNLFSIFFHYLPRWRPIRSRTPPPFPRSLRWRRELAAKRIKPTRFELLGQSFFAYLVFIRTRPTRFEHFRLSFFLLTLSLLEPGLPGLNILG